MGIAAGKAGGYDIAANGFAQNGWGVFAETSAFLFEFFATLLFVTVILNCTAQRGADAFAGLAIGLTLVAIHLAGIMVSGSFVNPARSRGPALFAGAPPYRSFGSISLQPRSARLRRLLERVGAFELKPVPSRPF
ncbi:MULTISPECIES: aquaporin [Mesorhizobium]|uniref:aquaporin n=1 Tax=Mesorhizobium TaxID=68287 RepID=UPI001FCE8AD3|nr:MULTISPECIES: aquaporin [Mesorhizobium]